VQRAESEASKCASARRINLLADAERYCAKALELLRSEGSVPQIVLARVHTEVAALAIVQKRYDDSARHCEIALPAWRNTTAEEGRYQREREQGIEACEKVLSAVRAHRGKQG